MYTTGTRKYQNEETVFISKDENKRSNINRLINH